MEILNQKLNQRFLERNNYLDLIVTNPIAIANELGYAEPFTEIHNE